VPEEVATATLKQRYPAEAAVYDRDAITIDREHPLDDTTPSLAK
jgi:hypothetical protein